MEDLKARLGALQRFVPVYTPWLNGTAERLNRDLLQVVRALLLEFELDTRNWVYLLPVIQSNLNQTPVRSLMGKSPMEVFTGLSREPIMNVVVKPREGAATPEVVQRDNLNCEEKLEALRRSLAALHEDVVDEKERRRLRQQAAKKGKTCTFSVGDFVLWSRADPRMTGSKLMVRWVGPFKVVEELPTSFLIEHLLTGEKFDVHAIRLKHYADNMLEVTEEL
ncbi:unnamed protein product [Phytophthora fragariaefolia]|uniref:Unnamed protein product n=1 Tax=Phytophthora fragariaefolia TaxID=1490495 RepID=A0A9W6UCE6_9STRA|nr:unnamed protein product [Phytophthora fragariaefolia]